MSAEIQGEGFLIRPDDYKKRDPRDADEFHATGRLEIERMDDDWYKGSLTTETGQRIELIITKGHAGRVVLRCEVEK